MPSTPPLQNLIGGTFRPPDSNTFLDDIDPATAQKITDIPDSGAADVNAGAHAARLAFPEWADAAPHRRAEVLLRLATLIEQHLDELAALESLDTGKPVSLARRVDIPRAAENLRFFATAVLHTHERAFHTHAGTSPQTGNAINYTLRRPRGVAGCISPWNLPLYLLTWKIAPALATGNTVVAKPSEVTPLTAHRLAQLSIDAGFPPGVLNIIHGRGTAAGAAVVTHPDIPTISFTGSTSVGRWIAGHAGPMVKRLRLELGGKNPLIIFDDADLEQAIPAATRAAFTNQGQICLCGSRVLAHRGVFQRVVDGLAERARELRIGDPSDPATEHGAVVSAAHRDKILGYLDSARSMGASVHAGGGAVPTDRLPPRVRDGYFIEPTVLSGLPNECPVIQEEIFGPVVTVQPFDDEAEAVRLANSTNYGLAASIWTRSLDRAHRTAAAVDSGIVWINCWMLRDLRTPFGGMKQSGLGREGGTDALSFFTEPKNICLSMI